MPAASADPPTSVLLPTTGWTPVVEEIAGQLGPGDELLVVCDTPSDPVTDRAGTLPAGVRLVVAGEPEGCTGKANAVAAGMETAANRRIVWTDDDFHHPPGWLAALNDACDRHGPVSELPFFVGRDPLGVLLEPVYALGATLGVYAGGRAWGGAVAFERDALDESAFLADLRRTVSDDGLLTDYLDVTPLRRVRRVAAGGTVRESLERHVRFTQLVDRHLPRATAFQAAATVLFALAWVLAPLYAAGAATLLVAGVYAAFGVRRWTALLACPALLAQVVLGPYALARRTFVWGGRRYRWPAKFEVERVD